MAHVNRDMRIPVAASKPLNDVQVSSVEVRACAHDGSNVTKVLRVAAIVAADFHSVVGIDFVDFVHLIQPLSTL